MPYRIHPIEYPLQTPQRFARARSPNTAFPYGRYRVRVGALPRPRPAQPGPGEAVPVPPPPPPPRDYGSRPALPRRAGRAMAEIRGEPGPGGEERRGGAVGTPGMARAPPRGTPGPAGCPQAPPWGWGHLGGRRTPTGMGTPTPPRVAPPPLPAARGPPSPLYHDLESHPQNTPSQNSLSCPGHLSPPTGGLQAPRPPRRGAPGGI